MPLRRSEKDLAALNMAMAFFLAPFSAGEFEKTFTEENPTSHAGIAAYITLGRQQHALLSIMNAVPAGVLILNHRGTPLWENFFAGSLLDTDPEGGRVRAELRRVIARARDSATSIAPGRSPSAIVHAETRTSVSRYRIMLAFLDGWWFAPSGTAIALIDRHAPRPRNARELASRFRLTRREIETAHLLEQGLSSRKIASTLGISVTTARHHVEHVLAKLDVHSRSAVASRLSGE